MLQVTHGITMGTIDAPSNFPYSRFLSFTFRMGEEWVTEDSPTGNNRLGR